MDKASVKPDSMDKASDKPASANNNEKRKGRKEKQEISTLVTLLRTMTTSLPQKLNAHSSKDELFFFVMDATTRTITFGSHA